MIHQHTVRSRQRVLNEQLPVRLCIHMQTGQLCLSCVDQAVY